MGIKFGPLLSGGPENWGAAHVDWTPSQRGKSSTDPFVDDFFMKLAGQFSFFHGNVGLLEGLVVVEIFLPEVWWPLPLP